MIFSTWADKNKRSRSFPLDMDQFTMAIGRLAAMHQYGAEIAPVGSCEATRIDGRGTLDRTSQARLSGREVEVEKFNSELSEPRHSAIVRPTETALIIGVALE